MVSMPMLVRMIMSNSMGVRILQDDGADNIYDQSQTRDQNGFVEMNRERMHESIDGFNDHKARDASKDDGAGVGSQDSHFPSAKTIPPICGMPPGKRLRGDGDK